MSHITVTDSARGVGPDGQEAALSEPNHTIVTALGSILQTVFRLQHKQV